MPKNTNSKSLGEIRNKIYTIRGRQVMLDYDLAEIYGYTTSAFNQQVLRNIDRFRGDDFMFEIIPGEEEWRSISHFVTSIQTKGNKGGRAKSIRAFTEQGIYMLMTVLKGELAVRQSRALVMTFKAMKDYILDSQSTTSRIIENTKDILELKANVRDIKGELGEMIKKSDISPILLDFSKAPETRDFLIMNGEVVKAKDTIAKIYSRAEKEICIIDNYVNYETLHLLLEVKQELKVVLYTSNKNSCLRLVDIEEFTKERPDLKIELLKTDNSIHDRYIILDNDKIFNLGSSTKDAGNKMTSIHEITDDFIKNSLLNELAKFTPELKIK